MRRGDAELLDKARIRLGHLRTPIFVVTPYNCVNGLSTCYMMNVCYVNEDISFVCMIVD